VTDETTRLLADLARAKAVFQRWAIMVILTERGVGIAPTPNLSEL
jgi:hypothetical protein